MIYASKLFLRVNHFNLLSQNDIVFRAENILLFTSFNPDYALEISNL